MAKIPENANMVFKWIIFDVFQYEQKMYDGSTKIFEKLRRKATADIITILENWNFCIIEQEQPWKKPYYTFPGWTIEEWEEPNELARRELLEETWLVSNDIEIYKTYNTSWKIDYPEYFYIARNCKKVQDQELDSWEKIKLMEVTRDWLVDILADPKFSLQNFAIDVFRARHTWKEEELKKMIFWK